MSLVTAEAVVTSAVSFLWLAGHEGMEKNMETTVMGYYGLYRDYYTDPFLHS